MKTLTPCASITLITLFALLVAGCGGGSHNSLIPGGESRSASAAFTIKWPERTRLIPLACESIKVEARNTDGFTATKAVNRPEEGGGTATITLERLPVGEITFTATAYPAADVQGTAQAVGSVTQTGQANQHLQITLTMGSTIESVELTPANPTVGVNGTRHLTATAKNAAGEVVLVPTTSAFTWISSNPAKATVDGNGLVAGIAEGTTTITATEKESGKSAAMTVTVQLATNTGVTLQIVGEEYGFPMDVPFAAFQDGDGAWHAATRTGVGRYSGTVTNPAGRYGFAWAYTDFGTQHRIYVLYSTTGELTHLTSWRYDADSVFATATVDSNVTGLTAQEYVEVCIGTAKSPPDYPRSVVPGTHDVFATTYIGVEAQHGEEAQRMIHRRGVSITGSTTLNFDFLGGEAFNLVGPYTVTITGGSGYGDVSLFTPKLGDHAGPHLGGTGWQSSSSSFVYRGLPAHKLAAGEGYVLQIENGSAFKTVLFATPRNFTLDMSPSAPLNCSVSYGTTVPYLRPAFTWEAYDGAVLYGYDIEGNNRSLGVNFTPGWAEGRTSMTFPDFTSVAGWDAAWGIPAGATSELWGQGLVSISNRSLTDCLQAALEGQFSDGLEMTTFDQEFQELGPRTRAIKRPDISRVHPLFGRRPAQSRR